MKFKDMVEGKVYIGIYNNLAIKFSKKEGLLYNMHDKNNEVYSEIHPLDILKINFTEIDEEKEKLDAAIMVIKEWCIKSEVESCDKCKLHRWCMFERANKFPNVWKM